MYSVLILTWKAMIATQQVLCNPAGATMHLRRCFSFPVLFTLVFIAVNKVLFCSCSSFALHSLKQHCYTGERRRQVHRPQSLKQHCYTGEREQKQHCYTGERVPWPDIWTTSARALPGWPSRHIMHTRWCDSTDIMRRPSRLIIIIDIVIVSNTTMSHQSGQYQQQS